MKNVPELRFKGLESNYEIKKISSLLERVSNSVDVNPIEFYRQIGIRSHGKGIFYKDAVSGESLGNKRVFWVEPNVFILNIVFAWERAVAKTTDAEIGMIASHRFPMYKPKSGVLDLDYITLFFKTTRGKYLLELASPGGAGRNKTLGQKEFENLELAIPTIFEQKKIAAFFSLIDKKIELQTEKVEELKNYKKGLMQKIFSQELRFKDENGNKYPEWEEKKLGECLISRVEKQVPSKDAPLMAFTSKGGIESKGERYDRSFLVKDNAKTYKRTELNDFIYSSNNLDVGSMGLNKYGTAVISDVYEIFKIKDNVFPEVISLFLHKPDVLNKILKYRQGALYGQYRIHAEDFLKVNIKIPGYSEQEKIASFFSLIDKKLELEMERLEKLQEYKKGLLQQMFI